MQKQPTPRKGTETSCDYHIILLFDGNNPHPARGRKLRPIELNRRRKRNNPHPARGRKPSPLRPDQRCLWKQPTPRKGTETRTLLLIPFIYGKQPTPRKGTETHMLFLNLCMILETTHTPQGDGNFHSQNRISAECSRNNPHPARGRKPGAASRY